MLATLLLGSVLGSCPSAAPGSVVALAGAQEATEASRQSDPAADAKAIVEALKGKDAAAAAAAVKERGRTAHPDVVKAVAGGLDHKDPEVRKAALRALRFNEAPEATDELLKVAKNKKALEEREFALEYYLALGQKGHPRCLPVLADNLVVDHGGNRVTQVRVAALGRIRDRKAVEEIMSFLVKGRGFTQHPYIREANLALAVLTGEDLGGRDQWMAWWNDNKSTFKVSPAVPEDLPPRIARAWEALWMDPEQKEAAREKARGRGAGGEEPPEGEAPGERPPK